MIHIHIVTGFLGTGKTTTLRALLKQRPAHEKWVVLLNEFGKTGLDSELLNDAEVMVSQVAGGCLCCATPLLFQTALNKIIRFERPQRILIEPSGLGHPDKIIELLQQPQYQNLLTIEAVLTLVDARHLAHSRYRQHDIYQRQLAVADLFIANKKELASAADLDEFARLLKKYQRPGLLVSDGQVPMQWWQQAPQHEPRWLIHGSPQTQPSFFTYTIELDAAQRIDMDKLLSYLLSLNLTRVKGLVPTTDGAMLVNGVNQEISSQASHLMSEYFRLEIISAAQLDAASIGVSIHSFVPGH